MKAILTPKMNLNKFSSMIAKDIAKATKAAKKSMDKTKTNFQQVDPDFIIEISNSGGGDLIGLVAPNNNKDGLIWFFLNDGTDIRYAVMTADFVPKTTPGTLTTVRGSGGLSHFDFNNPRPGIEARLWTHIIAEIEGGKFQKLVIKSVKQFAKDLF